MKEKFFNYNIKNIIIIHQLIICTFLVLIIIDNNSFNNKIYSLGLNETHENNFTNILAINKLLTFSGTNYSEINEIDDKKLQLTNFTISAWFNTLFDIPKNSFAFIINKGGMGSDRNGSNMNYGIWLTEREQIQGGFETRNGDDYYISSKNKYNDGKWHHAAITYDDKNKNLKLYIDGNLTISNSLQSNVSITPDNTGKHPLRIGTNSLTQNGKIVHNFTGYLNNINLWNNTLDDKEIINIYHRESIK